MSNPELSIFFPAYNEAENLNELLTKASEFVSSFGREVEVIVVNDGSTDNTIETLKTLEDQYPFLKSIHHETNQGYGSALRSGFVHSKGKLVFFMDGDNQFRFDELFEFIKILETQKLDAVIGIRKNRQDNALRKLNTFLWCTLVRTLLNISSKDIDCAYKLFKKELISDISLDTTGAMISTELLFKVQKKSSNIREIPVNHYPRIHGNPTGANPFVILRAFKELFGFYFKNVIKN